MDHQSLWKSIQCCDTEPGAQSNSKRSYCSFPPPCVTWTAGGSDVTHGKHYRDDSWWKNCSPISFLTLLRKKAVCLNNWLWHDQDQETIFTIVIKLLRLGQMHWKPQHFWIYLRWPLWSFIMNHSSKSSWQLCCHLFMSLHLCCSVWKDIHHCRLWMHSLKCNFFFFAFWSSERRISDSKMLYLYSKMRWVWINWLNFY